VGSYGPCDISNEVKPQTAGVGFRTKSGWAAVVLLTGSIDSPRLCDNHVVDLSDPRLPETRQPYHAAFGKLETDAKKIKRRTDTVQGVTNQSITKHASVVVGSQLDPATIANPHVRAHALEGQLFRSTIERALNEHGIRTTAFLERDAYEKAATQLTKSSVDVQRAIQSLGRFTGGPWRAEQKFAALGAWVALCQG
jgi:hypothetical protein